MATEPNAVTAADAEGRNAKAISLASSEKVRIPRKPAEEAA
jgi:hypothetical protein